MEVGEPIHGRRTHLTVAVGVAHLGFRHDDMTGQFLDWPASVIQ